MISGIRNKKWFCQKVYSGGVGRTYGGDIDNFYFGYRGDRLIIWEAKHKNAERDFDGPQAYYLKKLVDNLTNLSVALVWVEHESDEDIIQLKDTKPIKAYIKYKGEAKGKFYDPEEGTTVHDLVNWDDRR